MPGYSPRPRTVSSALRVTGHKGSQDAAIQRPQDACGGTEALRAGEVPDGKSSLCTEQPGPQPSLTATWPDQH